MLIAIVVPFILTVIVGKRKGIDKLSAEAAAAAAAEVNAPSNGAEILIHVGIDTVSMNGDGFSYLVKVGDEVRAGTPLLKFSRAKIKVAGHPDTAVFVVTNPNGVNFKFNSGIDGGTHLGGGVDDICGG